MKALQTQPKLKLALKLTPEKTEKILETHKIKLLEITNFCRTKNHMTHKVKRVKKELSTDIQNFIEWLRILKQRFPKAFPKKKRVVLKIGIREDIMQELNLSKTKARKFLQWYTTGSWYIEQHKTGVPRYDLEGNVVGYVTPQQEKNKLTSFQMIHLKGR